MDKIITLENLKEFKNQLEQKLPDLLESALTPKDPEEEEEVYGVSFTNSPEVQDYEDAGELSIKTIFIPKVVGDDEGYSSTEDIQGDQEAAQMTMTLAKVLENTYGVSPFIVFRFKCLSTSYDGIDYWLTGTNDEECDCSYSTHTNTEDGFVSDVLFDLRNFSNFPECTSLVVNVELLRPMEIERE